jgi:hypothetical protein
MCEFVVIWIYKDLSIQGKKEGSSKASGSTQPYSFIHIYTLTKQHMMQRHFS